MYLGDNLLRDGITDLVEAFRESEPDALILLTPRPGPRALRRRRAERRGGRAPDREAEGARRPTWRSSASTCSGRQIFDAAKAIEPSGRGRARDHRRDPVADRQRQGGREPHGHRLVEGHRPARRHAGGRTASSSRTSSARSRASSIDSKVEGRVIVAGGREARARGRARPGDHRRRLPHHRRLHRPLHVDRRRGDGRARARSSIRSCSPGSSVTDLDARMEASLLGRNVTLCARRRRCPRRCA